MTGFAAALGVFLIGATAVLRLLGRDVESGNARATSGVAVWLVYFFHAQTVVAAAYADIGRLDVPRAPFMSVGLIVAVAGWLLFLAATVTLVRRGRFDGLTPTVLVTTGPYRFSRHPQNAGWALLLLGVAITSRSVIALAFVAVFAVFSARLARVEEAGLERRHGGAFRQYSAETPTLPGPPPRGTAPGR